MRRTVFAYTSDNPSTPSLLIGVLIILDSMHYIFARLLLPHIAPEISVLYVFAISTVEVGLYGLLKGNLRLGDMRRHFWFFMAIAFLLAISINIDYQAVAFVNPGVASLLSQTSILFGLAFGIGWMHDRLSLRQAIGALLTIAGAVIISFQKTDYLRLGSLLIIVSSLSYALHTALAKRHGNDMEFLTFFFGRLSFTTVLLFAAAAVQGALAWPSPVAWGLMILVGTVDIVLSRALYYVALRRLTMSAHTLVLRLSPVVTMLWALLLFRALPTLQQTIGGIAIIVGVVLATLRPPDRKAVPA